MDSNCPKPPCKAPVDTTALKQRIVDDSFNSANHTASGAQSSDMSTLFGGQQNPALQRLKARLDTLAAARKQ